ncbi:RING finger protein [Aspergillus stella-maris]|uniref:RING finger protein n=1 Tax=Aspergillus stella-maris TaxID=1810926 RepID=UPI003CCCEA5D
MARPARAAKSVLSAPVTSSKRKREDDGASTTRKARQKKTPAKSEENFHITHITAQDSSSISAAPKATPTKGRKVSTEESEERRSRRFRKAPPKSFQERVDRAVTQRMFVVGQKVGGTDEMPELKFDIVGSTGNIYKTTIGKEPTCSCPDAAKGNQCKHICYVLVKVLKAPTHLQYQLAFLSSEIREIYENSPLRDVKDKSEDHDTAGKRKPVDGDCPICFMEFEPETEDIVWCRAACGNNIHKTCFQKWAASQNHQGVRCVYCRSPWQNQDADGKLDIPLEQLVSGGRVGRDGYINVASQVGLSGRRGTEPSLLFKLSSALGAPAIVLFWLA